MPPRSFSILKIKSLYFTTIIYHNHSPEIVESKPRHETGAPGRRWMILLNYDMRNVHAHSIITPEGFLLAFSFWKLCCFMIIALLPVASLAVASMLFAIRIDLSSHRLVFALTCRRINSLPSHYSQSHRSRLDYMEFPFLCSPPYDSPLY